MSCRDTFDTTFPLSFRLTLYNRYIPAVDNSLTILLLQTNRQEEEVKQCCLHFDHPIQEEEAKEKRFLEFYHLKTPEEEEEED